MINFGIVWILTFTTGSSLLQNKIQLNPNDTANTINNGFTISATDAGAKYNGKNEQIAIKVAPSNAH